MEHTKLSIIIPTLNAAQLLQEQVTALRAQNHPPDQILVVDSSSTDQTADLARRLCVDLVSVEPDSYDHGATRNLGADRANGDILIFMTQDALPVNIEMIANLLKPLQEEDVIVSYARQLADSQASLSEKYLRLANYPPYSMIKKKENIPEMGIKAFQNSNVCAAYKRKEFYKLGRFPAPAICNEDMIYAARAIMAGYKVSYSAEAEVWHTHTYGYKEYFKRYFDIAVSLDHEPQIRFLGNAESKGFEFLKEKLLYIRDQKKYHEYSRAILEAGAKYLGYKIGGNHSRIPKSLKKYLGMNRTYWRKAEIASREIKNPVRLL